MRAPVPALKHPVPNQVPDCEFVDSMSRRREQYPDRHVYHTLPPSLPQHAYPGGVEGAEHAQAQSVEDVHDRPCLVDQAARHPRHTLAFLPRNEMRAHNAAQHHRMASTHDTRTRTRTRSPDQAPSAQHLEARPRDTDAAQHEGKAMPCSRFERQGTLTVTCLVHQSRSARA